MEKIEIINVKEYNAFPGLINMKGNRHPANASETIAGQSDYTLRLGGDIVFEINSYNKVNYYKTINQDYGCYVGVYFKSKPDELCVVPILNISTPGKKKKREKSPPSGAGNEYYYFSEYPILENLKIEDGEWIDVKFELIGYTVNKVLHVGAILSKAYTIAPY